MKNFKQFSTPLARDLFALGAEMALDMAEPFKARPALSREEAERNARAAIDDEVFSEGRVHRNTRPQRHE